MSELVKRKRGHGIEIIPIAIKSATTAGLLLAVWGAGFYNFGLSWVIGASVFYYAGKTYHKSLQEKQEEEEEEASLARVDELPTWVYYPDVEKAEWLNMLVQQMWPFIGKYVSKTVKGMEPKINENLPGLLQPFKFEEICMGTIPPRVGGVKVYIDNVKRDEIVMDIEISYIGDCDITVSLKGAKAGIKDVLLHGIARIIMRPLINKIPLIAGVEVCFLKPPDLHFDLTNLANVLDVPFLNDTMLKVISDQMSNIVVLPNFIRVDLVPQAISPGPASAGVGGVFGGMSIKEPAGVILVRIPEADDLKRADAGKLLGKGKSDPYAQVIVDGVTHTTKVIKNSINPRWDERFEFIIGDVSSQMEVRIFDKDDHMKDDFLGNKYIKLEQIVSKRMDEWMNLDNIKTGRIHLISEFFHLTYLSTDPLRVKQSQGSTAVLLLGVESAKDLPKQGKELLEPSPVVHIQLANNKYNTAVKKNTTNPRWDESFQMLVANPESEMLFIQVQDSNKGGEILGTVTFKLLNLLSESRPFIDRPFQLRDSKNVCHLNLKLGLRYLTKTQPSSTAPPSVETPLEKIQSPFNEGAPGEGMRFRGKKANTGADTKRGRIQLTVQFNADKQKLYLTVLKAADLIAYDKDHFSDPYVNIYLKPDEKSKMKTEVIKNNLNPTWNQTFEWSLKKDDLANRSLEVTVKNHIGVFEKHSEKWMGVVILDLSNFENLEMPVTDWYFLQDPTGTI